MTRINQAQLEAIVKRINIVTGSPLESYVKDAQGKYVAQIGNYHLDWAYGGVSLHRMHNAGGGIQDVLSIGHCSKKELYSAMHAFLRGIDAAEEMKGAG